MSLSESFSVLRPHIDEATTTALARLLARAGATPRSSAFSEAVVSSAEGGKRFRALMAHVGWSLSSGRPLSEARLPHLAAALELYQASALVHDDIIDHADERRGAPTPHRRLADLHRGAGWIGSSGTFGRNAAILVGDFLFSAASAEADEQALDLPEANARAFARSFADMHAEVALGQYLDIMAEQSPAGSPARRRAERSRFPRCRPAQVRALFRRASRPARRDLRSQLDTRHRRTDRRPRCNPDALGAGLPAARRRPRRLRRPTVTGKPAGDDLREGKRTVLLALTWAASSPAERTALANVLGVAEASADEIAVATQIVERNGRNAHEAEIANLVAQGHRALDASAFGDEASAMLRELCDILTARRA